MKEAKIKREFIEWVDIPKSTIHRIVFGGFLFFSVGLAVFIIRTAPPPPVTNTGKFQTWLIQSQGTVTIRRGSQIFTAIPGMGLENGDYIQTGPNSLATVKYFDDSTFQLTPNAGVIVKETVSLFTNDKRKITTDLVEGGVRVSTTGQNPHDIRNDASIISFDSPADATVEANKNNKSTGVTVEKGSVLVQTPTGETQKVEENKQLVVSFDGSRLVIPVLPPPRLKSPNNLAAISLRAGQTADVTFSWSPIPGARLYKIQVAEQPFSQATAMVMERTLAVPLLTIPFKSNGVAYYWRVAAIATNGKQGFWSEERQMQIVMLPPEPGNSIQLDRPTLTWYDKDLVEVSGTTEPGISLRINGVTVLVDNSGKYNRAIELKEGQNTLRMEASGPNGRTGRRTETIR